MNLLREYIRKLLTESVDPKMMELIDRLEEKGWKIKLRQDRAILFDPVAVKVHGTIGWMTPEEYEYENYGPCLGANLIHSVYAAGGFGPVLYDVALETAGDSGLMSDRFSVSKEAAGVWNYYMRNRSDVQVKQMDNKKNLLTPDDDDNCDQRPAKKYQNDKWPESSLSKVYYKSGTPVIDELERRGLLVGRK